MRAALPVLASAALAAAALYGLLASARRQVPSPADPWLEAWTRAGLKAEHHFDDEGADPIWWAARKAFRTPPADRSTMRRYIVENAQVQVVELPGAGLLPDFPEGRHPKFKLGQEGDPIHLCRRGRRIVFVSMRGRDASIFGRLPVPQAAVDRIFDAFEPVAEGRP
jgi:hypothetical protein